jgi:hypothetical protein
VKVATLYLRLALGLIFLSGQVIFGQQLQNQEDVKAAIISIQKQIVDLTNPLEPFDCREFIMLRKSIHKKTCRQIVRMIKNGELTTTQSEIAIGILTGLPEADYCEVTSVLLSPKIPGEILHSVLDMPLPYGPCYANSYNDEIYRSMLLKLKTNKATSNEVKLILSSILSGEAAKTYKNYLKHPDQYGYPPIQTYSTNMWLY